VPKSRTRQKAVYTPPPPKVAASKKTSAAWVAPTIVASLLFGLVWIVVYYTTNGGIPGVQTPLGGWNMVVGFAFIIFGVGLSTQWR
jgi:hypothetical protein